MEISSLARSLPGQYLLPNPKGMEAPGLGLTFYLQVNETAINKGAYIYKRYNKPKNKRGRKGIIIINK